MSLIATGTLSVGSHSRTNRARIGGGPWCCASECLGEKSYQWPSFSGRGGAIIYLTGER